MSDDLAPEPAPCLRLGYVPGVTPGKWARQWSERWPEVPLELIDCAADTALDEVRSGGLDAVLARPAAEATAKSLGLALIRLYDEQPVVVVPKDHVFTAVDEVPLAELADEALLLPVDDVLTWPEPPARVVEHRPANTAEAIELVAAGIGVLVVPQSLARLHHRRDLTYRPVLDGPVSTVGLLWPEPTAELVEEFVGIVRGRRAGSSRGGGEPAPKRSASQKAADRRAARVERGDAPAGRGRSEGRGRSANRGSGGSRKSGGRGAGPRRGRR